MDTAFDFLDPGRLVDGDLRLVLVKKHAADPVKKHVPSYVFDMRRAGRSRRAGRISLRIGSARRLRYPGHIGYWVSKRHRGNRFAARSCTLLLRLARAHGLKALWINCDPKNVASQRTCELAGGRYVETLRIPKDHEMYRHGSRYLRRYRIDLRKALSDK